MNTSVTTSNQSLNGKVAFIQGGSRGIGAAIAKRLAREGAAVAFSYANSEKQAQQVVQDIETAGGRALALRADSADAKALTQDVYKRQFTRIIQQLDAQLYSATPDYSSINCEALLTVIDHWRKQQKTKNNKSSSIPELYET